VIEQPDNPQTVPNNMNEVPPQPQRVPISLPNYPPTVTFTIIAITVVIFLLQIGTKAWLGTDIPGVIGIKANELIRAGQLWRLFTPMLLHDDTSIMHIGFNMYFLFIVGQQVERITGHGRFVVLYILSGFTGVVASFLFSPYYSWGASGALFGLLGAEAVLAVQNRALFQDGGQRLLKNALTVAGINILIGFMIGADNWGHIGGLVGGAMFSWFAGPKLAITGNYPTQLTFTDQRGVREILNTAALVFIVFGGLIAIGIYFFPSA